MGGLATIWAIQIRLVLYGLAILSLIFLLDVTDPSGIDPAAFEYDRLPFEGPLEVNNILEGAERLFEGQLVGAESLVGYEGHIYTGTADGKILEIYENQISTLAILGTPPCGTHELEKTCGRPLGMRMARDRRLIVVDSYLGLFKVNITTGEVEKVFEGDLLVGGVPLRYTNDVDESRDGKLYVTDTSTRWTRPEGEALITEGRATGRLFTYDPKTKKTELLVPDMYAANGVQLSPEEDFVLITESGRSRIQRYWLKGEKAGSVDLFANLPGLPDNIRRSQSGGYWVAMGAAFPAHRLPPYCYLTTYPTIRKVLFRLFGVNFMLNPSSYGLIIELDAEGEIVRSLHDPSGEVVPAVSEVLDQDGVLTLGSYFSPYITRIDSRTL